MSKEEQELAAVIEEILQHDPLANTGAFPCGLRDTPIIVLS